MFTGGASGPIKCIKLLTFSELRPVQVLSGSIQDIYMQHPVIRPIYAHLCVICAIARAGCFRHVDVHENH